MNNLGNLNYINAPDTSASYATQEAHQKEGINCYSCVISCAWKKTYKFTDVAYKENTYKFTYVAYKGKVCEMGCNKFTNKYIDEIKIILEFLQMSLIVLYVNYSKQVYIRKNKI